VAIQGNTETAGSEWRFRRSGHISGLDNSNRDVLRPGGGTRYSQVGAAVHGGRNTYVTYARRPLRATEHPQMSASRCATSATPFDVRSPILAVSGIDHTGGRTAGDQFPRRPRIPSRKIRGARERRLCECTTTCRRSASRGPAQANVTHGSLVAPERPPGDRREIAGGPQGDRRETAGRGRDRAAGGLPRRSASPGREAAGTPVTGVTRHVPRRPMRVRIAREAGRVRWRGNGSVT
jgi:hypothetical protein